MKEVVKRVVDDGEFYEVFPLWAPNIVIGFARLDGRSVGIVANQPKVLAGTLDYESSEKAARFIRFLRRVQHPDHRVRGRAGFLPGTQQEYGGSSAAGPSCSTPSPRPPCRKIT
jgi:acetyl-CoA carboxylase carboxyltransferase component